MAASHMVYARAFLWVAAHAVLTATVVPAELAPAGIPPGGRSILRDPLVYHELQSDPALGSIRLVDVTDPGITTALEIASFQEGNDWDAQLYVRPAEPISAGDILLVSFAARAVEHPEHRGSYVKVSFEFPDFWLLTDLEQPLHAPYLRSLMVSADREWRRYYLPARATKDLSTNECWIAFRAGMQNQLVQFADIQLHRYGPEADLAAMPESRITYPGRESDAPWRLAARERIRAHRMSDIKVSVVDEDGRPVSGVPVQVRLRRHAFEFGIAFDAPRVLEQFNPRWQETRTLITNHFTGASFINEFKWQAWAGDWPEERFKREHTLAALRWVRDAGLPFRGHNLVWPRRSSVNAEIVRMLDKAEPDCAGIREAILQHMQDVTEATSFWVQEWDLLNEPIPCRDIQDACGDDVMVEWFEAGRRFAPGARLAINEYGILSAVTDGKKVGEYERLIGWLIDRGAPVVVLGMQGHFKAAEGIPSPERIYDQLNRFASFGKNIRSTEFDVASNDPELVRDVYRDFYTIMFSHPSVIGIQVWEWSEVFDERDEFTPAGRMHHDLVFGEWMTDELVVTDANGEARLRGFKGEYDVCVRRPDGTALLKESFSLGNDEAWVVLRSP